GRVGLGPAVRCAPRSPSDETAVFGEPPDTGAGRQVRKGPRGRWRRVPRVLTGNLGTKCQNRVLDNAALVLVRRGISAGRVGHADPPPRVGAIKWLSWTIRAAVP